MKKKLFFCGLSLVLVGLCLCGAGWMMDGSTEATIHLFGRSMVVSCQPIQFYGWSSDTPVTSVASSEPDYVYAFVEQDTQMEWDGDHYIGAMELDPFQTVDIDVAVGDIYIQTGGSYGVSLDWQGENYALCYSNEGGTLKVWSEGSADGATFFSDNIASAAEGPITQYAEESAVVEEKGPYVTFDIPRAAQGLAGVNANVVIYIPEGARLNRLDCDLALGGLNIYDITAEAADLSLDLGDLYTDSFTVESAFQLDSGMGDVDIYGASFQGETEINADMGDIYISGDVRGDVNIDADMGDVDLYLTAPASAYRWGLDVSMGDIALWSEDGTFSQNVNGSVHGGSGDSVLDVEIDMGNIDVCFNSR